MVAESIVGSVVKNTMKLLGSSLIIPVKVWNGNTAAQIALGLLVWK
jgi:hypothetical protein